VDRHFAACKQRVHNRGVAPDGFLNELVDWVQNAADDIFEKNEKFDICSSVIQELGPWEGALHRRATMLEVLRVLGGFESPWDLKAGRDVTNPSSNTACTEEAGSSSVPEIQWISVDDAGAGSATPAPSVQDGIARRGTQPASSV
jgi:hypothetical protein